MTNSKKNKEIPVLDQSDTDSDDIDYYFTILLVFISSITDETVLIRMDIPFPGKISFYAYQYIIRQGEKILRAYGVTILITVVGTFF